MRKIILTIFILGATTLIGYKTLLTPHLILTAKTLNSMIHKQEIEKDCTCWSTVRMMEFHQARLPLTYFAMTLKIEAMKTLLWNIWQSASSNDASFSENLLHIIGQENAHWLNPITNQTDSMTLIENQQYHYHRLT
tara:strand:- start:3860 stop:4267 length:408 start_codon:yes stop_codon:yes gene_type:complete